MTPETQAFVEAPVRFCEVGTASIAYRVFGEGPVALFIHGWPLWGVTWRQLVARLKGERTCVVVDLPGSGDTLWSEDNDFSSHGHARNLARFVAAMGWTRFDIVAHDTGATTARYLAWLVGEKVRSLALFDTEIPHHRPQLIVALAKAMTLPGVSKVLRASLKSRAFVHSNAGFGGCFRDRSLLDGDFTEQIIQPLIESDRALRGSVAYVGGIDWQAVDALARIHGKLTMPVTLVWGTRDGFFPIARARAMGPQFADYRGMLEIEGGKLLTHEEYPDRIAPHLRAFWDGI